ncbi:uncharacterized protein LOC134223976 [Armigeres subalbatus]|uniref:uncharacterized protein LOC134223976 n=1 Tax=Armigeres subalbatus TaxID=124917 RepID=UPI002ED69BFF
MWVLLLGFKSYRMDPNANQSVIGLQMKMRFSSKVAAFFTTWLVITVVCEEIIQRELQLHPETPRRGRFLGLLGLLTGLSLVDSYEEGETRIRPPAGIVKINIGRPLMESFYQYAYNPYFYGSVPTINIKIPLRPDGEHDGGGFGGAGFGGLGGVGVIGSYPGQFGTHGPTNLIEPRPTFADPVETASVESAESAKKLKPIKKTKRSKISSQRINGNTLRSNIIDNPITEEDHLTEITTQSLFPTPNQELNDPSTEEPLVLHATAIPVIENNSENTITTQGPFLTPPPADFQQPIPQSYFPQSGSLQDPSEISITTAEAPIDPFRASRIDRLQDYYNRSSDEFRPVASAL